MNDNAIQNQESQKAKPRLTLDEEILKTEADLAVLNDKIIAAQAKLTAMQTAHKQKQAALEMKKMRQICENERKYSEILKECDLTIEELIAAVKRGSFGEIQKKIEQSKAKSINERLNPAGTASIAVTSGGVSSAIV